MGTRKVATSVEALFTVDEWRALLALRTRYAQDRDLFSRHERAHLHFLNWLYRMGRLVP